MALRADTTVKGEARRADEACVTGELRQAEEYARPKHRGGRGKLAAPRESPEHHKESGEHHAKNPQEERHLQEMSAGRGGNAQGETRRGGNAQGETRRGKEHPQEGEQH